MLGLLLGALAAGGVDRRSSVYVDWYLGESRYGGEVARELCGMGIENLFELLSALMPGSSMKAALLSLVLVAAFSVCGLAQEAPSTDGPVKAKVLTAYTRNNTTKLVIESNGPLVSGRNVYVGSKAVPVTVDELLSRTENDYYYNASASGKLDINRDDIVNFEQPKAPFVLPIPGVVTVAIKEHYTFEQKDKGEITAVQGDRAMIDRGSLHEVRERDLYKIYDPAGKYKGLLELRGIGDYQSQGKVYTPLSQRLRHRDVPARIGDRVTFAGQRKLFGLGCQGGVRTSNDVFLGKAEQSFAGGLIWDLTFPAGWGVEMLFGTYGRSADASYNAAFGPGVFPPFNNSPRLSYEIDRNVSTYYIAPIWLKKNLFYPSVVSPFVAVGLSFVRVRNHYKAVFLDRANGLNDFTSEETKNANTVAPTLGLGVEFFQARFFRPRLEVRYFNGPRVTAAGNTYATDSIYVSAGFLSTW